MARNVARSIDKFFAHHGSPMAGTGRLFVRYGRQFGVDPRLMAAIAMKETEGGLTGTGRASQGYGAFGMGPGIRYPSYKPAIRDATRNVRQNYLNKGYKSIPRIAGKWAPVGAGNDPNNTNPSWAGDVAELFHNLGGQNLGFQGAGQPRRSRQGRPGVPGTPGIPGIPGVQGELLPNPTETFQRLGDIIGVPWNLQLPDRRLPDIPGVPAVPGTKGKKGSLPKSMPQNANSIMRLLQATQQVSKKSAGYSKATARGPLGQVDISQALDCSLSVARVLQMAGLGYGAKASAPVSGEMAKSWGKPGKGKFLTMWASDGHVFLEFKIKGRYYRFDTSSWGAKDSRSGPRLRNTRRSTKGFTARHWPGL